MSETARLRLFASAREAAGSSEVEIPVGVLGEIIEAACSRFGPTFAEVVKISRIWVNGEEPFQGLATRIEPGDEVAVLPPVSGG
ncbi:MAG: MoaD family protein [Actinobacteria bacterium]|nr:MoaD family protein [Actinomycetota bacterium]